MFFFCVLSGNIKHSLDGFDPPSGAGNPVTESGGTRSFLFKAAMRIVTPLSPGLTS